MKRCRQKLLAWADSVKNGENLPFPELDDEAITGMVSFSISRSRFIASINDDGRIQLASIPNNACVMSPERMLEAINEPNGIHVNTDSLLNFVTKTIDSLSQRFNFYENSKIKEESEHIKK